LPRSIPRVSGPRLPAARAKATAWRRRLLEGGDPLEDRRAARARTVADSLTFQVCAERYIDAHQASWRNGKHRAQWKATLATYVYPVLGALPVAAVDTGLVMQVLEPIWQAKPETASRVRGRIETVLDWASARGHRDGDNPARWRGHLQRLLPARAALAPVKHHKALPYAEIPAFMAAFRQQAGTAARCLELTILTAARTGEAIGARWSEVDLEAKLWRSRPGA
jgi:integrase